MYLPDPVFRDTVRVSREECNAGYFSILYYLQSNFTTSISIKVYITQKRNFLKQKIGYELNDNVIKLIYICSLYD